MRVALLFLLLSCLSYNCRAEFDISYSFVSNGGAESGMTGWYYSSGVSSISSSSVPEGSKCFRFIIPASNHADLRSPLYPIRKGEALQFRYSFKSSTSATIQPGSSYAVVRSYGLNTSVVLSETRFNFNLCSQWTSFNQTLTVDPNAYYLDVRFMFNDTSTGFSSSGTMYVDNILVYRDIHPAPFYGAIKPLQSGRSLYVYDKLSDSNSRNFIAIQTLQGVLARVVRPMIWIHDGDNPFRADLAANYGINFIEGYNFASLLNLGAYIGSKKYILYDIDDTASISAATALAGVYNAVAIDVDIEPIAISKGYTLQCDVRGKDCRWVYENYREHFADTGIVVHQNNPSIHPAAYCLRDWAPAMNFLEWWYSDENYSRNVYSRMAPCSPVYGWTDGATDDEGLAISMHTQEGLIQIPSDWMHNLTVHASMGNVLQNESFKQLVPRAQPQKESNVHYVTFIMSDMDNILTEVATNSFYSLEKYYANPHRGEFPMSWGMAASLVELAPTAVKLWYNSATPNDSFTAFGGLGYFYPSMAPYLQTNAKRLGGLMERADLRTLLVFDNQSNPAADLTQSYYDKMKWYTSLKQVRGIFYLEYNGYARHNGQILWFDRKPLVTARFDYSSNNFHSAVRTTAADLAASINALPTNPASSSGYTVVIVHAWSKSLTDVYDAIQLLDSDVRVVHAEDFIEQLYLNMKPCQGISGDGDFDGDCRVGVSDLAVLVSQWLYSGTGLDVDANLDGKVDYLDFNYLGDDWQKLLTEF